MEAKGAFAGQQHMNLTRSSSTLTRRLTGAGRDDDRSSRMYDIAKRGYPPRTRGRFDLVLLLLAALGVVHGVWPGAPAAAQETAGKEASKAAPATPRERAYRGALPPNVEDMREQILAAVHAGDVAELKGAIEWNEIKPDFGKEAQDDPIAHWSKASSDGHGRAVLAVLANMLALPPARLALGRDPENALVYVWPYLAELPLDTLTPAEQVDLYRLMPVSEAEAMIRTKKWTWWRVAIGADGTWHTFRKYP